MSCGDCGKTIAGRIIHGAIGVTKSVVGIDHPGEDVVTRRVRICVGHPTGGPDQIEACPSSGTGLFCKECGCVVAAKIRIKSERCPLGKW